MAENKKSKKDTFRERFQGRYPDVNVDNEDDYYEAANQMLDDYESFENNSRNMRDRMMKSPVFAEMIVAAGKQDDFDPVVWMVENKGLDLQALQDDPDYSKKLADAHNTYIEKRAKQDEIEKQMAENMPASIEAVRSKAAEMGLTDEQAEKVIGQMYQVMDDLIVGKIDPAMFELMAKGMNFDTAVQDAKAEGIAEGLGTKIDDKLVDLNNKRPRAGGSQRPAVERRPAPEVSNPFLA